MIRSIACSKSACVISSALRRPAQIAASLQMFARSAPVRPAVWRAIDLKSTSAASGLPRVCTARIATRPLSSGGCTRIWRSKRPGPQQRRVEVLQPVRRGHHDHLVARAEAVELDQQLVQRLILLAVERRGRCARCRPRRARR